MAPLHRYSESVTTSTSHGPSNAAKPSIAAVHSMRLFVVRGSRPINSRSNPSERTMQAQPPGPGLPMHEPSVVSCIFSKSFYLPDRPSPRAVVSKVRNVRVANKKELRDREPWPRT